MPIIVRDLEVVRGQVWDIMMRKQETLAGVRVHVTQK